MRKERTNREWVRDQPIRAMLAAVRDLYRVGTPDPEIVQRIQQHAAAAGITRMVNRILLGLFNIRPQDMRSNKMAQGQRRASRRVIP